MSAELIAQMQILMTVIILAFSSLSYSAPLTRIQACREFFSGSELIPNLEQVTRDFQAEWGLSDSPRNFRLRVGHPAIPLSGFVAKMLKDEPFSNDPRFERFERLAVKLGRKVTLSSLAAMSLLQSQLLSGHYANHLLASQLQNQGVDSTLIRKGRWSRILVEPDAHESASWQARLASHLRTGLDLSVDLVVNPTFVDGIWTGAMATFSEFHEPDDGTLGFVSLPPQDALAQDGLSILGEHELFHVLQALARRSRDPQVSEMAWPSHFIHMNLTARYAGIRAVEVHFHQGGFGIEEIGAYFHSAMTTYTHMKNREWSRLPKDAQTPESAMDFVQHYAQVSAQLASIVVHVYENILKQMDHNELRLPFHPQQKGPGGFNINIPEKDGVQYTAIGALFMKDLKSEKLRPQLERALNWARRYEEFWKQNEFVLVDQSTDLRKLSFWKIMRLTWNQF